MPILDLKKFIVPTLLENTDEKQKFGNKSFQTKDLIYLDSIDEYLKEVKQYKKEQYNYPIKATDYAIANGAFYHNEKETYSNHWLRSAFDSCAIDMVSSVSRDSLEVPWSQECTVRPSMRLNVSKIIFAKKIDESLFNIKQATNSAGETYHAIEFGKFPKSYVGDSLNKALERKYKSSITAFRETGNCYTSRIDEYNLLLASKEYEYEGKRYVRLKVHNSKSLTYTFKKSKFKNDSFVWINVEPITWEIRNWDNMPVYLNPNGNGTAEYIDVRTDNAILTLPFYLEEGKNMTLWQNSTIRGYLNGINVNDIKMNGNLKYTAENGGNFANKGFLKEAFIVESEKEIKLEELAKKQEVFKRRKQSRLEKINPDMTPVDLRRNMTDSEIIKSWIDAGQSVLLRGPSGIGKTERIKRLYPNLIYIKLTNNMFPEKVVGSMNLQTGQVIPPNYAKEAILSCATKEEKKLVSENIQNLFELSEEIYERSKTSTEPVVILLDELLNVKPAVQSLVYTLVLNKFVETGKGLKLPANTVVVATGNQKKYSSVAEDLAEPLEKRFDHILDMEPKVREWIYEYAMPNKVHPTVIGYIFSRYLKNKKSEKIYKMPYFYEEPEIGEENLDKNGCKGKTNDPRGWVSISNMLYSFEEDLKNGKFVGKNVENLLKTSLYSKLRDEWAEEFFEFYNNPTLTVEDVMKENYTKDDLPNNINERFAQLSVLLSAKENEIKKVREFVRKNCDPEYLEVYDLCWAGNDPNRAELISELRALDPVEIDELEQ